MNERHVWRCFGRLGAATTTRILVVAAALALFLVGPVSAGSGGDPVAMAVEDLAARLGAESESIEIVSRQEVTWPDTSAGCPKPGMMYAQVLTNGSRLILALDGKRYHYHSRNGEDYFFCPNPEAASSADV